MDAEGRLDEEEIRRVDAWIADRWRHGPCPVCEANSWAPNLRIGQIENEATFSVGETFPVLLIFCTECGYTLSINARIAGIRGVQNDRDEQELIEEETERTEARDAETA